MPAYWYRRRFRKPRYQRRKRWPYSWRFRKTLRRRYTTRRKYRRHRKVKFKKLFKKRTKIILKQFNPKSIRNCKIIGSKCLLQGSPLRCHHNYIQYAESKIPPFYPGGGGWSLLVFSLDSLFEDHEKLQNIWTTSNAALPLVRYLGCTFKFYQCNDLDYFVTYDTCWPMVDTPHTHADSSPQAMFLKKRKICVPSRQTQKRRKPYKKVTIKPPSQMLTKWYFQRDICKTPLLMLTTTGISLTNSQCAPEAKSNNITITVLNPLIFNNLNFQTFPKTTGYFCKIYSQHEDAMYPMYLWVSLTEMQQHTPKQTLTVDTTNKPSKYQLIPLINTLDYTTGTYIKANWEDKMTNWGNPFHDTYTAEHVPIYISTMTSYNAKTIEDGSNHISYTLTLLAQPITYNVRYNPETDKGNKNIVYMLSTSKQNYLNPPEDKNLIFEGFPLPILLWGWSDWIKKAKFMQDPDQNGIIGIITDQFDINLPIYIPIDKDFLQGFEPYTPEPEHGSPHDLTPYSKSHWYPKLQFQDQSIEKICTSQPGSPRMPYNHYMQVYCRYKFRFKWGGCPKQLEKVYNPCSQSIWTTPDNIHGRPEIQNPITSPSTELWSWDWKDDYVTQEAIDRIQSHTEINQSTIVSTDNKTQPKAIYKTKEKEACTKEEENLLKQLNNIIQQRQFLEQLLCNRIST